MSICLKLSKQFLVRKFAELKLETNFVLKSAPLVKAKLKSILNFFAVFYATINVCCMTTALISLSRAMALWNFESAKKTFTWKKTLIYYAAIWIYSIGQFVYSVTNICDVFKGFSVEKVVKLLKYFTF